jgi:hypothetical protein
MGYKKLLKSSNVKVAHCLTKKGNSSMLMWCYDVYGKYKWKQLEICIMWLIVNGCILEWMLKVECCNYQLVIIKYNEKNGKMKKMSNWWVTHGHTTMHNL